MPFDPNPVQFHDGDTAKLVSFHDQSQSPTPWVVGTVTTVLSNQLIFFPVPPQPCPWSFANVHQDTAAPDYMRATLCYNVGQADQTLLAIWAAIRAHELPYATLEMSVNCGTGANAKTQTLLIKLSI